MKTQLHLHVLVVAFLAVTVPPLRAQIVADGATNTLSNVTNTFPGDVTVGTNGSFTLLVLSDNSLLTNSANATIGVNTTARSNEVRLVSPTARWEVGGAQIGTQLLLGSNGPFNRLVISNGASVRDFYGFIGQNVSSSNNLALVTGSGSLWSHAGFLFTLGSGGAGNQLVVSDGGLLLNEGLGYIGLNSSNNLALVTDSGSVWSNAMDLRVGLSGPRNQLVVSNGAWAVNSNAFLGFDASSSNNAALVTDAGTVWSNRIDVIIGNSGSGNRLMVSNGATVFTGGDGLLGYNTGANSNMVTVTGIGSVWRATNIYVGRFTSSGNGVVVSNGGMVISPGLGNLGYFLASANSVLVTGPGSLWSNGVSLLIGQTGSTSNRLDVNNGGVVRTPYCEVGSASDGSDNVAAVTGSGSLLSNATLIVGQSGQRSQLFVSNAGIVASESVTEGATSFSTNNRVIVDGGTLRATNAAGTGVLDVRRGTNVLNAGLMDVDQLVLTNTQGFFEFNGGTLVTRGAVISNGAPFVVGASGTTPAIWDVLAGPSDHVLSGDLSVGNNSSFNQLLITNGALLTNSLTLSIGSGGNSNTMTISGPGSRYGVGGTISVSGGAFNRLVVNNGGALFGRDTAFIGGLFSGTNNQIVVTGPGSVWNELGQVEFDGRGNQLLVTDGGSLVCSNANEGFFGGGSHLVLVAGPGSVLNCIDTLGIGSSGRGNQLQITNGALVTVGNSLLVGANNSSTNNLVLVDNSTLRVTNVAATGLLEVRRGTNVLNAGLEEVDQLLVTNPAARFEFNGGTLSVKNTRANNGTQLHIGNGVSPAMFLLAGNGLHEFTPLLLHTVSANATIMGNGTIAGLMQFAAGSQLVPGTSVGGMIFSNAPALQGTVLMELSKNGAALTNDQIQLATGTLTYGGLLIVSNLGPTALAAGDRFPLFSATSYSGSFTTLTLPPLDPGLTWTNKLLVDGSIEVVVAHNSHFWTNVLGGSYQTAANWLDNVVPLPLDDAYFTSNATYQVSWAADAVAANAYFNAGSGTVTQAVGSASWTLTNSYVIGQDAAATAAVTHVSGSLRVTNAGGLAQLKVSAPARGTLTLSGGEIVTDSILLTNGTKGVFNFNGGTLSAKSSRIGSGTIFSIGNGVSPATMILAGNGVHDFSGNLVVMVSSNAMLTGNGTLLGGISILAGGTLIPGNSVGKMIFSNAPSLHGTVIMEISKNSATLTNDQVQVTGTLTYGGTLIVSNLGPTTLAPGDKFQLFNTTNYAGSFSSITLPPLGPALTWKTNLVVDGSIEVLGPPAIPISTISTATGGSYSQDFSSLATNANVWRDGSTLLGWYAAQSTSPFTITTYRASDGSDNNGALYSFGSTGSADRALGSIASDSVGSISYGLCFSNDTFTSVSNFTITYTGEQWRNGGSSVTNTLTVWYKVDPSAITNPEPAVVTNWTQVTNLTFVSPTVSASVAALNGNQATNQATFSAVLISGLVVPPRQHVFFRWRDANDSGPDQGMALDDLTITFSPLAPKITSASFNVTNGFFGITGQGESNLTYGIEAATNLNTPIFWQRIGSNTANGSGLFQFTDTNAPAFPTRFYRARFP